jgi:NifU-like protein involved in Fe-S cluster formation
MGLKRYTDARESYERALKLDEDNDQINASLKEAAEKEEQSIKSGTIVFAAKRKRDEDGKKSAVGAGKKVKNKTLLSFNEEEDE